MSVIINKIHSLEVLTAEGISVPHCFTTRFGGVSTGSQASMNLAIGRGDSPENVEENLRILGRALILMIFYLSRSFLLIKAVIYGNSTIIGT